MIIIENQWRGNVALGQYRTVFACNIWVISATHVSKVFFHVGCLFCGFHKNWPDLQVFKSPLPFEEVRYPTVPVLLNTRPSNPRIKRSDLRLLYFLLL